MSAAENSKFVRRTMSALRALFVVSVIAAVALLAWQRHRILRERRAARLDRASALATETNPADLAGALEALAPLLEDPNDGDASAIAAEWETERWRLHRIAGAEAVARDLLAVADAADSRVEARFAARSEALCVHGEGAEAEQLVLAQRERGVNGPLTSVALAHAYQRLAKFADARLELQRASGDFPTDARVAAAEGETLIALGLFTEATDRLDVAAHQHPRSLQIQIDRVLARLYARDHLTAAWSELEALHQRDAELSAGLRARVKTAEAELELAKGDHAAAMRAAVAALAENPDEPLALFARARALSLQHDPNARAAFLALAGKTPMPLVYEEGARWLEGHGDEDSASALRAAARGGAPSP